MGATVLIGFETRCKVVTVLYFSLQKRRIETSGVKVGENVQNVHR